MNRPSPMTAERVPRRTRGPLPYLDLLLTLAKRVARFAVGVVEGCLVGWFGYLGLAWLVIMSARAVGLEPQVEHVGWLLYLWLPLIPALAAVMASLHVAPTFVQRRRRGALAGAVVLGMPVALLVLAFASAATPGALPVTMWAFVLGATLGSVMRTRPSYPWLGLP